MTALRATALAAIALLTAPTAFAEPYLAAREGFKCMMCHVNPTGGGMRNSFGNDYAQHVLAAEHIPTPGGDVWSDVLDNLIDLGGNLRTGWSDTRVPHQSEANAFATDEFRLYLMANVIPERLAAYVDEQMAPGGSLNREAYVRLWSATNSYYVKVGQMYLPYGLRLQDNTAFIREAPGINMTTPDNGVELGMENGAWSVQLAGSNGSGGGAETDQGKQVTLRAEFVQPIWRLGASVDHNHAAAGNRQLQSLFSGLRTGPVVWLGEADYIVDDSLPGGRRGIWAGLLEGNWGFRKGFNAKLTGEYLDPNDRVASDQRTRYSGVFEWTPIQYLQLRLGARLYQGIPQNDLQNRRLYFVQLHGFF